MKFYLSASFILFSLSCFAAGRVFDYPSQCNVKRRLGYEYSPEQRNAVRAAYLSKKKENLGCFTEFSEKYVQEKIRRCEESGSRKNIGGGCLHDAEVMGGCEMQVAIEYCQ